MQTKTPKHLTSDDRIRIEALLGEGLSTRCIADRQLENLRIFVYNAFGLFYDLGGRTMDGYISIRETSYKWGVSERRVNQYCSLGRIPGAERFGRSWAIPSDAGKPSDPRKSPKKKQERGMIDDV